MVQQQSVNTGNSPEIVIEGISGDLRLTGWDRQEVFAKTEGELSMQQDGNNVRLHCEGESVIRVPEGASLRLQDASGDARIKGVKGAIQIAHVSGDLGLREVGATAVDSVSGDLSIKHVAGDLHVGTVSGDCSVGDVQKLTVVTVSGDFSARGVQGPATIVTVSGDASLERVQGPVAIENTSGSLRVAGVQGPIQLGNVDGDANVSGVQGPVNASQVSGDLNAQAVSLLNANVAGDATITLAAGFGPSTITASGDIVCRFVSEANATVHITSEAANIAVTMPGSSRTVEEGSYELKLGTGEVPVALNAKGDVTVVVKTAGANDGPGTNAGPGAFDFDFDFGHDFDMGAWGRQMGDFGERIAERARQATERATAEVQSKVQAKVERATRKAQDQVRRAERRAQWMGQRVNVEGGWRVDRPPVAPEPPREPVSDEERLTILRMLEQKKITVQQAEQLLAALSGRQGQV